MFRFLVATLLVGGMLFVSEAQAHGRRFRRGAVVVNSPRAQVIVGRRGFRRPVSAVNVGRRAFRQQVFAVRQPVLLTPQQVFVPQHFQQQQFFTQPLILQQQQCVGSNCAAFFSH